MVVVPPRMSKSRAQAILRRSKEDPEWFFTNILGCEPWEEQLDIAEAIRDAREVSVRSCHGAGKSWTAARVGLWFACTHRPSIVITTAPTDRQVKGIIWKEIRLAHQKAIRPLGGKLLQQELKWHDDWWMWGFTAPDYDPDRFQGFHESNVLVIVDEAAGVSALIFEAIDGILSGGNSRLLLIGNPTNGFGAFADSHKPNSGFSRLKISAFDTPNFSEFGITQADIEDGSWQGKIRGELPMPNLVTPEWVATRYKRWGRQSPLYEARVLAEFPSQGQDTLISLQLIEEACNRDLEPVNPSKFGIDVARYGDDETVIGKRRGPHYRTIQVRSKQDTMRTAGEVIVCLKGDTEAQANIDVIGVGSGVVDRVIEQGYAGIGVNVGSKASEPERFINLRAEIFWTLKERFEDGHIDIDREDEELQAELASLKWKVTSKGLIQMESKDEMKRRGLRSPNRADAMALAFAEIEEENTEREFMIR